jgi:hypothetical protein
MYNFLRLIMTITNQLITTLNIVMPNTIEEENPNKQFKQDYCSHQFTTMVGYSFSFVKSIIHHFAELEHFSCGLVSDSSAVCFPLGRQTFWALSFQ